MINDINLIKESMTSVELAEFSGRRHDHLLRDIDEMFKNSELDIPNFGDIYLDSAGREQKMYNLNKPLVLFVISKFNDKLRLLIVNRMFELEEEREERASSKFGS